MTKDESTGEFRLKNTTELRQIQHDEANMAFVMYLRDLKELRASMDSSPEKYTSRRYKKAIRELQDRYRRRK